MAIVKARAFALTGRPVGNTAHISEPAGPRYDCSGLQLGRTSILGDGKAKVGKHALPNALRRDDMTHGYAGR
jgi:hypothetical protein